MKMLTNRGALHVKGRFYTVQFGDTLYLISQRFGVNIADLLQFNDQLKGLGTIYPGEILYIPVLNLKTATKKKKAAGRG